MLLLFVKYMDTSDIPFQNNTAAQSNVKYPDRQKSDNINTHSQNTYIIALSKSC